MKYATTLAIAAVLAINGALAASDAAPAANANANANAAVVPSPLEALDAAKKIDLPPGVTLTGTVDTISEPAASTTKKSGEAAATEAADADTEIETDDLDHANHKEWYGGAGLGGFGHWGGWGGWG
jgi:hypothetical protein